jgi:hypothetical protein
MSSQSPPGGRPPEPPDGRHSRMRPVAARAAGGPPRGPEGRFRAPAPAGTPARHRHHTGPAPGRHLRPALGRHRLTTHQPGICGLARRSGICWPSLPRGRWRSGSPGTRQPCGPHPPRTPSRSPFSLRQEEVPGRRQCPDSPVAVTPAQPPYSKLTPAPGTWQPLPLPRWVRSPPQQTPTAASQRPATQRRRNRCGARHRLRRNPAAGGRWVSRARSSVRARLTHRTPPAQPPDPRCPGPRPVQAAHRPRPRHRPPSPSQRSDSPSGGRTHGPSRALPLGDR